MSDLAMLPPIESDEFMPALKVEIERRLVAAMAEVVREIDDEEDALLLYGDSHE